MITLQIRSLAFAAGALVAFTGHALAQDGSPALLSAVEVQRLIARAEPADHARLKAHFAALADQDAAEARRHNAMQQAYSRNTKMGAMATSMSAHCKRLADISLASATASRAMAAEHDKLAAGATVEPPRTSPPARSNDAAAGLSDTALAELVASASTAADHRRLEEHFTAQATRYDREAADHTAYAKSWRSNTKVTGAATIAGHCERIAAQRVDAAKEARTAAAMHKQHAAQAK